MEFNKRQIFPFNELVINWMAKNIMSELKINKQTKIASIGSCFAREIRNWLIGNGFNYLVSEDKEIPWESSKVFLGDKGKQPYEHASIAWERVYNTFTLKHIVDYTFGHHEFNKRLVEINIKGKKYFADLLRNRIIYKDRRTAERDILKHAEYSKDILNNIDLLIITLGLTEIWESKERGFVVASNPYKHYELPRDFKFRASKYQENLYNLVYVYNVLKQYNPNIKILITVSPVSLIETFRKDVDVITANCESKSTLRSVAGSFAELKDVYYFPSYEIATTGASLDGIKMCLDGHHISKELIDQIMNIFSRNYA